MKLEPKAQHPGPAQLDGEPRETRIDALDVESLTDLSIADLRKLWLRHMGRAASPAQKRLLIRELAWRAQERVHGGLDAETRRLLSRAMRAATADNTLVDATEDANGVQVPTAKRRPRGAASTARVSGSDLTPATKLSRVWQGVRYEVCVLDGGRFRLGGRDETFASLSEIAREITGTRWSGPRFFGLRTRENSGDEDPRSGNRHCPRRNGGDS
ncbi:MAG: DUF2924 domain-containing protein [Planctomycetota bacterium]|nr:DUF2924 domain-containing protein [Planctomycetota bacterium]